MKLYEDAQLRAHTPSIELLKRYGTKVACSHLQESHLFNLQIDKEFKNVIETALCYDPEV